MQNTEVICKYINCRKVLGIDLGRQALKIGNVKIWLPTKLVRATCASCSKRLDWKPDDRDIEQDEFVDLESVEKMERKNEII